MGGEGNGWFKRLTQCNPRLRQPAGDGMAIGSSGARTMPPSGKANVDAFIEKAPDAVGRKGVTRPGAKRKEQITLTIAPDLLAKVDAMVQWQSRWARAAPPLSTGQIYELAERVIS
jgi:hypothetical protein